MRRVPLHMVCPLAALAVLVGGCGGGAASGMGGRSNDLFAPREVKLHPVFTKITSWEGDDRPDGIEALVELRDQFDDTTKGAGTFSFELYEFRRDQPDPRGRRLASWQSEVISAEQQRERWSKTSRCYTFRLAEQQVRNGGSYVLAVAFTPVSGPRAFDRVVLGANPS